jgi:glycosyltransferase involved in cell wall biosynthesis
MGLSLGSIVPIIAPFNSMRIVLTVHQFLPDHAFGTEIITLAVARELLRRGHEVQIVTGFPAREPRADGKLFDRYTHEGIPVERFHHYRSATGREENHVAREYDNRDFYKFFGAFLRRLRPDLVHLFHLNRISASAVDAGLDCGVPMVLTATDFWAICPYAQLRRWDDSPCTGPRRDGANCVRHVAIHTCKDPRLNLLLRKVPDPLLAPLVSAARRGLIGRRSFAPLVRALVSRPEHLRTRLNRLDRIIAPSELMREKLVANGIEATRILHLPYGIETAAIAHAGLRGEGPALRLGYVGSLIEHKGCDVLIRAIRLLPNALPVELRVFGSPEHSPKYCASLRGLAGEDARIRFCGPFANADAGTVLASVDVLVVPSIWYENTPVVIYEAMAAGCAVLASDVPGIAEVIHDGENGWLFPCGDAAALAERIRLLAGDRREVQRVARNVRPPLSIAGHVRALEAVYRDILAERRRSQCGVPSY